MPARNTLVQLEPCTATLRATMHSVTDRWTDGRHDDANIADHSKNYSSVHLASRAILQQVRPAVRLGLA